jgi:hypothetical protein
MTRNWVEYRLQEGGGSSVPSSMALRSTKYDRQLRFFSLFSSSFFFLSFFRSLLFQPLRFLWAFSCWFWFCFIPWRDWFVCVDSFYLKSVLCSFMILLWVDMVPEYGGSTDNQRWSVHTSVCSIVDLQDQKLWRTWCSEESVPSQ